MESFSSEWVEARERHRDVLFGSSTELAPALGDVALAPLTTLTFNVLDGNEAGTGGRRLQSEIVGVTHAILAHHNTMAANGSDAIFGIGSREGLTDVANLTAGVILRWLRACSKSRRESPFDSLPVDEITDADFQRRDVQLVVETAAAVLEMLALGYRIGKDSTARGSKHFANLVARRGPVFAAAWASGHIARTHIEAQGGDAVAIMGGISRPRLISFATRRPRDPLQMLLNYSQNLQGSLSLDSLVAELGKEGWSTQRVATVFTPNTCRELARSWSDPLFGARRLAHVMDTMLTTEAIATHLGEDPEYVDRMFRPSDRVAIALSADPLRKLTRIAANFKMLTVDALAARLGWEGAEVEAVFTPSYCKVLAFSANLEASLQKIAARLDEELSVSSIAKCLGWSEELAASIFTIAVRKDIARVCTTPVDRLRAIATTRDRLISKGLQLPIGIINYLSVHYSRHKAYKVAQTVYTELANCPRGVGRGQWMWAVAVHPTGDRATWLRYTTSFTALLSFTNPVSLNKLNNRSEAYGESMPDPAGDFVDGMFLDEPSVYLQDLAARANVPYKELQRLLELFENDTQELSAGDQELLEKLRAVRGAIAQNAEDNPDGM